MNIPQGRNVVPTYQKLSKLPLGSITAQGWLREQLLRSKDGTGGHLDELEPDMIATPFINYSAFKYMPGSNKEADPTFAAGWSSEISGTYWTGLVQLAFTLNDPELIAKADHWIDGVLAHQEPDGYLGGYPAHTNRMADYNAWGSAWCYRAMLSYYEATGRQEVLDAVYKGLLWFCENWKDNKTDYVGAIITEPMVIVYSLTGDKRLVTFCEEWLRWMEDNSKWQNKLSQYKTDLLPYTAMHVVAYGEDMKHPAILYCATGEEELLKASVNAARKALAKIVQTNGGPSSCNEYLSPKGSTTETEYCNFSTFNHSYSWLAMATGQASWGDEMERILFNGAQGARKKDERAIAYMTAPNQLYATDRSSLFGNQVDAHAYAPCFYTACCPAQAVRVIPEFVRSMCLENADNDVYLFCYGPAAIQTGTLELEMDTLYPFRDSITLRIRKADAQTIHVRIPAWCTAPSATVNGIAYALTANQDGFAQLPVKLNTDDAVELRFPMEIKIVKVDDSDHASKFPLSIERGPLVYAIPVPEKWIPYEGKPITPLPEDWSWYKATPDLSFANGAHKHIAFKTAPWAKAIDEKITADQVRVTEIPVSGYVWENPPVKLEVPMYNAPESYITVGHRTQESFEVPLRTEGEAHLCTMVPYGCTNLRISYVPRADK